VFSRRIVGGVGLDDRCRGTDRPQGELIRGSLASFAAAPAPRRTTYDPVDQQKVAVLHASAGTPMGPEQRPQQPDGRPALIDGGRALTRSPADDIRSIFFHDVVGQPLDSRSSGAPSHPLLF
jgi:hypothetical protein